MKILRLHYFDTYEIFQGHRRFQKIGFEAEIDEDYDNVRDCYYTLKRKSEELFYESKAAAEKQMGSEVKEVKPKSRIESLVDMVSSATSMKELAIYKNTVDANSAHPELVDAYNQKSFELQNNS